MEQPDQSKSEQIAAIFDSYVLVLYLNGWFYYNAVVLVPTIQKQNHSNTDL